MRALKTSAAKAFSGILVVGLLLAMAFPSWAATTLRFAHAESTENIRHTAAEYFAKRLDQLTNGELKVEVYPSGQMGTHTQCQEMVASGDLDFYPTTAGLVSVFDKDRSQELIELPYLFDNYDQAYAFMDTDFVTKIYEPLQKEGIRYLATWDNGFRHMTNSVRPIRTPEDMEGLKIRVVKSEMSINIIKAMGASAVPMSYSELYTAMASGVVDGQENPIMNIYASKFYEVQDYLSLTKHQYSTLPLIMSEQRWQSLDKSQQKAVEQAALEAAQFMREKFGASEKKQRKLMEKAGLNINEVPDLTPFREAVEKVYAWASEKWGEEKVDEVLSKVEKIRKKYPEEGSYINK
ncbi:MAG: TRAP transporter substrate-binding protein [Desulfohalobiaceae bacterium]|nr:TRAP transporter substrate-binding protein [Desulfohalobiaceae bacterium]